jgi:HAE1 family hydrophobic/amphiphilic exporter-1
MFISDFAIKKPIVTVTVMVALVAFGIAALLNLQTDEFPDVQQPMIAVTIPYPGASPETVEREIVEPVEEALSSINGVDWSKTTSNSIDGLAQLLVAFDYEKPLQEASQDIRDAISTKRSDLPVEMKEPVLSRLDPGQQPVMTLTLTSSTLSPAILTRIADPGIVRQLRGVPGVANIRLAGSVVRELTVQLRPADLQAAGVAVQQVVAALEAQNLAAPIGSLKGQLDEKSIRLKGRLDRAEDFGQLVIATRGDRVIRLSQLADVFDGSEEPTTAAVFNGKDAVGIEIQKTKGFSTTTVVTDLKQELDKISKTLPAGAKLEIVQDAGKRVSNAVNNVEHTLIIGAMLTVLVVFMFLNSWRSTVITGLALPVSVLASFIAVWAFGFTLNTMSLLGLSLAIGILIDDAIVVRENIVRHVHMGKDHFLAAREGTDEIGLAVAATTFSIVAVFVPVGFMYGVAGQWFKPFALTIACAVMVSLFVSFSLDPMLSAYWTDPHVPEEKKAWITKVLDKFNAGFLRLAEWYKRVIGWALDHRAPTMAIAIGSFGAAIAIIANGLLAAAVVVLTTLFIVFLLSRTHGFLLWLFAIPGAVLAILLGLALLVVPAAIVAVSLGLNLLFLAQLPTIGSVSTVLYLLLSVGLGFLILRSVVNLIRNRSADAAGGYACFAAAVVGLGLSGRVPSVRQLGAGFVPISDRSEVNIIVEAPPGSNLKYTSIKAEEVARICRSHPEVAYTYTSVGTPLPLRTPGVDQAQIYVRLVPKGNRHISQDAFGRVLREEMAHIGGAQISVFTSGFGGAIKQIQVQLSGPDARVLNDLATQAEAEAKKVNGAVDVGLSTRGQKPELEVELNRSLAGQLDITVGQVAQALRPAFAGIDAGDWVDPSGETRDVEVRLAPEARERPADLERLPIVLNGPAGGTPVTLPLGQVASITQGLGPAQIDHLSRKKVIRIEANVQGRALTEVSQDITARIAKLHFPAGYEISQGGETRDQKEVFTRIFTALGVAVLLMYLILVVQFGSFITPTAILISLPLSLIGVVLALDIRNQTLNIMSLIGVILLMGIVAKNAILLIDFAQWAMDKGVDRRTALIEAGATRLRPILMTTVALIAGMIPTSLGWGDGADFQAPLGVAVIGGTLTSTLLTLLVIPTVFEILDDVRGWFLRMLRRLTGSPAPAATPAHRTGEHQVGP